MQVGLAFAAAQSLRTERQGRVAQEYAGVRQA